MSLDELSVVMSSLSLSPWQPGSSRGHLSSRIRAQLLPRVVSVVVQGSPHQSAGRYLTCVE